MSSDAERVAARNALMQQTISQVRGRAETSGGAVVVETDTNGTITDLRISQAAMSVVPERLAKAISQCHKIARERAQAEATQLFTELLEASESIARQTVPSSHAASPEQQWEESARPTRITHSL